MIDRAREGREAGPPAAGASTSGVRLGVVCAALAALCLAIYLPALDNGFVWDDDQHLALNTDVNAGFSAHSLRWALTTFHTGNWYPLTWASHLLDVELYGLAPRGHHLTNVILHCVNAVLLFLVLRRMTGAAGASAAVAALFAAHPLHVESVAWVAERKDLLSTLLWLLALVAWLGWARRPRVARYAAAVLLYASALAAKAMPVTFPFLLLLLDWWPLGRLVPGRRTALVVEKLPLVALAAASGVVALLAQSAVGAVGSVPSFGTRVINAVESCWKYVGKAIWPSGLALLYPFPEGDPSPVVAALALAGLAAVTAAVLRVRRRAPALATGWFWFLGTLVPVIGLVQIGTQGLADRYTYVPLTGLFLMAAWGIGALIPPASRQAPRLAACAVAVVALLAAAAREQVGLWRDNITAFENVVAVGGDSLVAHSILGQQYHRRGDDRRAERHIRAALAIAEDDVANRSSLGKLLARQGRVAEALPHFRAAARLAPATALYRADHGAALSALGRWDEGILELEEALRIDPGLTLAKENLAKALAERDARREK